MLILIIFTESFSIIAAGKAEYSEQDHSLATKAPLLKKSEAPIDWRLPASLISNKVRAFKPFPGTVTSLDGKKLGVEEAHATEGLCDAIPGTIISVDKESISVATGDGVLHLTKVKPAGKRALAVRDYVNGRTIEKGIILG